MSWPGAARDAVIPEYLVLGEDPAATATAIQRLRDVCSLAHQVRWQGRVAAGFDVGQLVHLAPPADAGTAAEAIAGWRDQYRYGLCYFRIGPQFITVRDRRIPDRAARFVIDEPDLMEVFIAALVPLSLDRVSERWRKAARLLCDEALVHRCGDIVVTLPTRLLRWPVPYSAI